MTLGIDLRCLPADGSPGAGVAHAAHAIADAIVRVQGTGHRADVVLYIPVGARCIAPGCGTMVEIQDPRRASLVRALKGHPCDILFVPSGAVPVGLPVPAVPWVHDVDIFSHPEWFPQSWIKRMLTTRMFLRGIRHAPIVFAVSEYTKRELLKLVRIPEERIVVTGEGGDPALASWDREKARERLSSIGITRPFVLMLGTVEPRKNITFITDLWSKIRAQGIGRRAQGYDLIIAGRDGWKCGPINEAIKRAGAIRLKDVDETLKRDLLVSAALVVTPSLSEGFGLVSLEAVQAGKPVFVSDRGALPEVVGQGEWVISPDDRERWTRSIVRVLEDQDYREDIVRRQAQAVERFTWEFAASSIWDRIRSLKA